MSDDVYKRKTTKLSRLLRLLGNLLNPRTLAHGIKVLNYYGYTHVAELRQAQRGSGLRVSPTASFANGRNIVLGDRVHIGANCYLWAGNGTARIVLGNDALLAPGVMITASNYRFNDGAPTKDQAMKEADVIIGDDVWLGYGAVVLPGTKIGSGSVIGAGAVVRGEIAPNTILSGNPGEKIGTRVIRSS